MKKNYKNVHKVNDCESCNAIYISFGLFACEAKQCIS